MRYLKKQCHRCPWKVGTDPYKIPNYSRALHESLREVIAPMEGVSVPSAPIVQMTCHETKEKELPCVGWIDNQLRRNNIGLRMKAMMNPEMTKYVLDGKQHVTFEDTLPPEN